MPRAESTDGPSPPATSAPTRRFSSMSPHRRVGLVTAVLVVAGAIVLAVALAGFARVDEHVELSASRAAPARDELVAVGSGLARVQTLFVGLMAEQDRAARILGLEDIRRQLSRNDEAWRRFRSLSLDLPGEADLVERYEGLQAELASLEGPVGLLLITAEDSAQMWEDPNFARLREIEAELESVVAELDSGAYGPLVGEELTAAADDVAAARRNLLLVFGGLMAVAVPVGIVSYRSARSLEREERAELDRREEEARRNTLETLVTRGLENARSEADAYAVVGRAMEQNLGTDHPAELLVVDTAGVQFRQVLSTDPVGRGPGCPVASPDDCPAARRNDRQVFPSSAGLDACPFLRNRPGPPVAAVCQPLGVNNRTIGVVHTTFPVGADTARLEVDLDIVARRAGERIGMIRAFAETEFQARTDPLTGLLNRRSLETAVRVVAAQHHRYCVAYGDLDHFKVLNDEHGHDVGDRSLRAFATVVRNSLRPGDLACRYGGEEFVLVLPDCEVDEAVVVVERLRAALKELLGRGELPGFTVSFGVASSQQADGFAEVVGLADEALLRAKSAGRDRVLVAVAGPPELPPASGV